MTLTNKITTTYNPLLGLAASINPDPFPSAAWTKEYIDPFLQNKKLHKTLLTLANAYTIGGLHGAASAAEKYGPLSFTPLILPIVYSSVENTLAWVNGSKTLGEAALGLGRDIGVVALSHTGGTIAGTLGFMVGSVLCLSWGIGTPLPAFLLSAAARIITTYEMSSLLTK